MKRSSLIHALLLAGVTCGSAQTIISGKWGYFIKDDGAVITGYSGPGGSVEIPAALDGVPVHEIGTTAPAYWGTPFAGRKDITAISVPDSVTVLGTMAFFDCQSVQEIYLGSGIVAIYPGAFSTGENLSSITVAGSNLSFASYQGALVDKAIKTLVHVPQAFEGTFTIPSSLETISEGAFSASPGVRSIDVSAGNAKFASHEGVVFSSDLSTLVVAPSGKSGAYSIPDGTLRIAPSAFAHGSLTKVTVPEGVEEIPGTCFLRSPLLEKVVLPRSLKTIGWSSFRECPSLGEMQLPEGLLIISHEAFMASSVRLTQIPDSVVSIGAGAFEGCINLETIKMGRSLQFIGGMAFSHSQNLKEIFFSGDAPTTDGEPFAWLAENTPKLYRLSSASDWGDFWQPGDSIWKRRVYVVSDDPSISIEEPAGNVLTNSARAKTFGNLLSGTASAGRVYSIRNAGAVPLTSIALAKVGSHTNDFTITGPGTNALAPGASTTFSVSFAPTTGGTRTARISLVSNDTNNNPFVVNLTGFGIGTNIDTDKDGLNDAAEFLLNDLGFNWRKAQPELVNLLASNANTAGFFSKAQYDVFGAEQFSAGRASVSNSPANYGLVSRTNIPAVRVAMPTNTPFTFNLGGTWTRYVLRGNDKAWTFNSTTGEVKGLMTGTNERNLRLTPYLGSQIGPQMIIQVRPAP
jgi:hypothetical protein